jgi:ABC-type uncharacterized transport system ATPase subunit
VTVLRRGRLVHHGNVAQATPEVLTRAMVGEAESLTNDESPSTSPAGNATGHGPGPVALQVRGLTVLGDRGTESVRDLSLQVAAGEILGIAGVSGNGQRELVEAIVGQRARERGSVEVRGEPYLATRAENHRLKVRSLPEEPLKNACVPSMSVADNMALRDFDRAPLAARGVLRPAPWRARARAWIADFGVKTQGEDAAIASLSGGNVQRAVLARELSGEVDVLVAANPAFGLDFAAVRQIHGRIRSVRERGGAVLLVSEDLDELLELADRIVVMSEGRAVLETPAAGASRAEIGLHMAGGHAAAAA